MGIRLYEEGENETGILQLETRLRRTEPTKALPQTPLAGEGGGAAGARRQGLDFEAGAPRCPTRSARSFLQEVKSMQFVITKAKPIIADEPMCKQGACNGASHSLTLM